MVGRISNILMKIGVVNVRMNLEEFAMIGFRRIVNLKDMIYWTGMLVFNIGPNKDNILIITITLKIKDLIDSMSFGGQIKF